MERDKCILLVAAVFVVVLLIGEGYVYAMGGEQYQSSVSSDGSTINYSVTTSGTADYSVVQIDNHGFMGPRKLVIYVDEEYDKNFGEACSMAPILHTSPGYAAQQAKESLSVRSMTDVEIVGRDGLSEYINSTLSDPKGCGILSYSYAYPGDICNGTSGDKLTTWVNNGGCFYSVGSVPGQFYYSDGAVVFVMDSQERFFGATGCLKEEDTIGSPTPIDTPLSRELCFKSEYTVLGVHTSMLTRPWASVGTMDGDVASATMIACGNGMVTMIGGSYKIRQMEDVCQIISSNICYMSTVIASATGRVTGHTYTGTFDSSVGNLVYVFMGKNYQVYGRAWYV